MIFERGNDVMQYHWVINKFGAEGWAWSAPIDEGGYPITNLSEWDGIWVDAVRNPAYITK